MGLISASLEPRGVSQPRAQPLRFLQMPAHRHLLESGGGCIERRMRVVKAAAIDLDLGTTQMSHRTFVRRPARLRRAQRKVEIVVRACKLLRTGSGTCERAAAHRFADAVMLPCSHE